MEPFFLGNGAKLLERFVNPMSAVSLSLILSKMRREWIGRR